MNLPPDKQKELDAATIQIAISFAILLVVIIAISAGALGGLTSWQSGVEVDRGYKVVEGPDTTLPGFVFIILIICLIGSPAWIFHGLGRLYNVFESLKHISIRGPFVGILSLLIAMIIKNHGLFVGLFGVSMAIFATVYRYKTGRSSTELWEKLSNFLPD